MLRKPFALALLAWGLSAFAQTEPVTGKPKLLFDLMFDGQRVTSDVEPLFACGNDATAQWFACHPTRRSDGLYEMDRLAPGKYLLDVSIDLNPANPREYPGDLKVQKHFQVGESEQGVLQVDLAKAMHLLRPADNASPLQGVLVGGCAVKPKFDTGKVMLSPKAAVDFAWEPVLAEAEYGYNVYAIRCGPPYSRREVLKGTIKDTHLHLELPPSGDDEYYSFRFWANHDGRLVGDFFTYDSGANAWNYNFRVIDKSYPLWIYPAVAIGALIAIFLFVRVVSAIKRSLLLLRFSIGTVVIIAIMGAGIAYVWRTTVLREQERKQQAAEQQAIENAQRQASDDEFRAQFRVAAPLPAWWDDAQPAYVIKDLGQLYSAWQSGAASDEVKSREFFKASYAAILAQPGDAELVTLAIDLMTSAIADYEGQPTLLEFAMARYFDHDQRTDNCYQCMKGDRVNSLASKLAYSYIHANRFTDAVTLLQRVYQERGDQIAGYAKADSVQVLAAAQWANGDKAAAIATLRDAVAKYASTTRIDDLKRSLARYEQEPSESRDARAQKRP